MNDELINKRDAISESESSLRFVLLTQMVKELNNLSSEPRCFKSVHKLRDHTCVSHPDSNFLVERQIKQSPESYLQKKSVVAGYKSIEFLDYPLVFHLVLVFSENTEFLQEVQDYEKKIRVVSLEHGHEKLYNIPVLHFPFNLKVLSQIKQQVESHKQYFLLLLDDVLFER